MIEQPLWLRSWPVQQLLNLLVDRMDSAEQRGSARTQSVALGERTWPALYTAQRESEKEDLWGHAVELVRWSWLTVKPAGAVRSRSGYAESPRVTVANESEVRKAVGRIQRIKSAAERWREAVSDGLQGDRKSVV